MEIEFIQKEKGIRLKSHTIRNIYNPHHEDVNLKEFPHFQAIMESEKGHLKGRIQCTLTYKDKDDKFLGFDEHILYSEPDKKNHHLSMLVTIPKETERAFFEISSEKKLFSGYIGTFAICAVVILTFIGLGSLFD